jgi:hypothetical protein
MSGSTARRPLVLVTIVLALALGACAPSVHGPWRNSSGQIVSNAAIVEFDGFNRCGHRSITFFRFFDRQYAKDPRNVLGDLRSPTTGELLTFANDATLPSGAEPTGFTHRNRAIWVDEAAIDDYLYIVIDDQVVERWPRAEQRCEE